MNINIKMPSTTTIIGITGMVLLTFGVTILDGFAVACLVGGVMLLIAWVVRTIAAAI